MQILSYRDYTGGDQWILSRPFNFQSCLDHISQVWSFSELKTFIELIDAPFIALLHMGSMRTEQALMKISNEL